MPLRLRAVVAVGLAALALGSCGTAYQNSQRGLQLKQASGTVKSWNGFGAKITAFKRAHPTHCGNEHCAGPVVTNAAGRNPRFTGISLVNRRVLLVIESLHDGTSLSTAEADVRKLLPSDVKILGFKVLDGEGDGPCAAWNLQSATIAKLLGPDKGGDSGGYVGVSFQTYDHYGAPKYDPTNVTSVLIQPYELNDADVSCTA